MENALTKEDRIEISQCWAIIHLLPKNEYQIIVDYASDVLAWIHQNKLEVLPASYAIDLAKGGIRKQNIERGALILFGALMEIVKGRCKQRVIDLLKDRIAEV